MRIAGFRAVATHRIALAYAFCTEVDCSTRILAEAAETTDAGHDQSRSVASIAAHWAASK